MRHAAIGAKDARRRGRRRSASTPPRELRLRDGSCGVPCCWNGCGASARATRGRVQCAGRRRRRRMTQSSSAFLLRVCCRSLTSFRIWARLALRSARGWEIGRRGGTPRSMARRWVVRDRVWRRVCRSGRPLLAAGGQNIPPRQDHQIFWKYRDYFFGRRPRGSPHTRPSCQTFARTTRRARGSSSVSALPSSYSRSSRSDGGRRSAGAATAHWTGGPGANDSRRKRRCGSPGHCSRRTVTSPTARRPTLPSSNSSWTEVPPRPRPHTATRPPRRTTKTTPSF